MITKNKAPWHIWVVGIIMLLWNSIGCIDFTMTQFNPETWLDKYTQTQRAYFLSFPIWANIAWACGVWGGFLGALMLLFRSSYALSFYGISLGGLIISNVFHLTSADNLELVGGITGIAFTCFLALIAVLQIWYSRKMIVAGVLR